MNEELINILTEENITVDNVEDTSVEVDVETAEQDILTEESTEVVEVETSEEIDINMEESIGWVGGDATRHYSLSGRNEPRQHEIEAITGLREELDEIERLKSVYSDKPNVANYYKWHDAAYDEYGYFVSIVPGESEIQTCNGSDIFGVSVHPTEDVGFIGNQDEDVPRDSTYGLVVTSGLVDVRCESDVNVGDSVVSNKQGWAKKSDSDYGYKVLLRPNKYGIEYATIMLGVQADVTNSLGVNIQRVKEQVDVNKKNIVSAVNVANQAYNESTKAVSISDEAFQKAWEAFTKSEEFKDDIEDMNDVLQSASQIAAQARAIAEGAANSATVSKDEAVKRANEAWAKADEVATEAYSLCAKIDQYSVGKYSQAYGLTFEQAQSILEPGMIYAPTKHIGSTEYHTEIYEYTNSAEKWVEVETDRYENKVYYNEETKEYWYYNGSWKTSSEMPKYKRIFTPGYLYQWGYLPRYSKYGWITIDKDHQLTNDESIVETNLASKAVYFDITEPAVATGEDFGYWYTDGDAITDLEGKTDTYEPYTLYKWEKDHWLAVATLKGNVSNRAMSEIYQTTNELSMYVMNSGGSTSGIGVRLTEIAAEVDALTSWRRGDKSEEFNNAIIKQKSDDSGSSIVISTYTHIDDGSEEGKVENQASLVLNTATVDGTNSLVISAKNIVLDGETSFVNDYNGETKINGAHIQTGTIEAGAIEVEDLSAFGANIGGWNLTQDVLGGELYTTKNDVSVGMSSKASDGYASTIYHKESLVTPTVDGDDYYSAVRFYAGTPVVDDIRQFNNSKFAVLNDGSLYAEAANISGHVNIKSGTIGGFTITEAGGLQSNPTFLGSNVTIGSWGGPAFTTWDENDSGNQYEGIAIYSDHIRMWRNGGENPDLGIEFYVPEKELTYYLYLDESSGTVKFKKE